MPLGMTDQQMDHMLMTVGGAGLAAKAVLTLSMAGRPITVDNAVEACRLWMDPRSPATPLLLDAVGAHVGQMLSSAETLSPAPQGRA